MEVETGHLSPESVESTEQKLSFVWLVLGAFAVTAVAGGGVATILYLFFTNGQF
ncbi:MAG: hypothetical protein HY006_03610 [Candidatus Sungbacteria bacterium]|nr:hypothetical protein [Candidatus Sungbacteria bacterium]